MKKLFRIKRLLKMRNSSGFTLVEVIISSALLSILVLGIMSFVAPVLRMVNSGEKNARATMLAETIDTYISGVLRTAVRVEIFQNVDYRDYKDSGNGLFGISPDGGGLNTIRDFMNEGDHAANFQVRCLGIVMGEKGIKVQNFKVGSNYELNDKPYNAFNDLMYDGLYPVIEIDTFKAQDKSSGSETAVNANGYKISTKVYSDAKCYNAVESERDKSHLAFEGVTFFELQNYEHATSAGTTVEPAPDVIKVYSTVQEAIDWYLEEGDTFYPSTLIFYIVSSKNA